MNSSKFPSFSNHFYSIVEAILSPVKYCLFQVLGTQMILLILGETHHAHSVVHKVATSLAEPARIGAVGGIGLAIFYLSQIMLQSRQWHRSPAEPLDDPLLLPNSDSNLTVTLSAAPWILIKETVYSAVASLIGAYVVGRTEFRDRMLLSIAGALGPIVFLVLMFGLLGILIGVAWALRRLMRW
ncbi:hypothetical protein CPC08DRAFT_108055 [Agrocybe pediades]|nr:hypothetical protein CPC08DRAFT_108055 [Agrocybe pediades]